MSNPLQRFLGSRESLRGRTLNGVQWLMIKSLSISVIELVRSMIFLRLLEAQDFGLMALAVIVPGFARSLTETGTDIMVQRAGADVDEQLPTFWTVNVIRSALAVALLWLLAGAVADFYATPALAWPIRLLSLQLLLNGLSGFGAQLRQRTMDFKPVAVAGILAQIGVAFISLAAAWLLRNYWAIVIQLCTVAAAEWVCSYLLHPWRPRWQLRPAIVRGVMLFAASAVLLNLFNYIHISMDRGVVGKLLDLEAVGHYTRAHFLALLPVQCFANVIGQVFLPAFRTIAHDASRLRKAFFKTIGLLTILYGALGLGLFLGARPFIWVVAGEKWMGIVSLFQILLLYSISKCIVLVTSPIFYLYKKPMMIATCAGIMAGSFALVCIPMTRAYGLKGMAWAVVLSGLLSHLVAMASAVYLLCSNRSCQTDLTSPV
ncbi:MAG TPA: hypothetical protein DCS43_13200 [Verrucomicrobia bacterium]|nr:hypothetical protein [Verrucomicrobiota bacterium]